MGQSQDLDEQDEFGQIVVGPAGERIGDDGAGGHPRDRPQRRQAAFAVNGIADDQEPAEVHVVTSRSTADSLHEAQARPGPWAGRA